MHMIFGMCRISKGAFIPTISSVVGGRAITLPTLIELETFNADPAILAHSKVNTHRTDIK